MVHFMCYKSLQRWTEPVGQYLLGKFYSKRQSYTDQSFPLDLSLPLLVLLHILSTLSGSYSSAIHLLLRADFQLFNISQLNSDPYEKSLFNYFLTFELSVYYLFMCFCKLFLLLLFLFETGFFYVALTVQKLALWTKLTLN